MLAILAAHAVGLTVFGVARGYAITHSLLEGGLIAGLALLAAIPRFSQSTRGVLAAAGLVTSSAMLVHFSSGSIEAHFHFFVVLGLMTLYQDWMPYGVALTYVVVHHGLFGVIDPASVYEHAAGQRNPWGWAAIHGAFVLSAAVVQLYSWRVNEQEHARAEQLSARLREASLRKREALRINDGVMQELVMAKLAASMGDREQAEAAVDAALTRARGVISDLLEGAGDDGAVRPGDLVLDAGTVRDGVSA